LIKRSDIGVGCEWGVSHLFLSLHNGLREDQRGILG